MQNKIKTFLFFVYGIISINVVFAQQNLNFVRSFAAQKPIVNEPDIISGSRTVQEVIRSTEYIDGFGRPVQSVVKQSSPLLKDLVSIRVYDNWGREVNSYLPF
ncbi:MAG TPA: DUF6443 domain-containing protein, partial [Bacteroidia bacterium]|nr:DUF6443 domain-containing protein [Bacteroidia bacterium]